MAIRTLADLIAAGAHRTLEQIIQRPDFDLPMAVSYLSQRYRNSLQIAPTEIAVLVGRVQDAVRAGQLTNELESPLEAEIPSMPGYHAGYTYTVIGELADPLRKSGQGRNVTFPMKFQSDTLLTYQQLRAAADELTNAAIAGGQLRFEGALHGQVTLPGAAAEIVRDDTGDTAMPIIKVLSIYRGA